MSTLALSLKLSAVKTLSAVQRAINILRSAGPGAWYDPSDLTTLFQDSAGTTPVTAVEQPVGLILDKSQGLVLGAELVASQDLSTWTSGGAFGNWGTSTATTDTVTTTATNGARYQRFPVTPGTSIKASAFVSRVGTATGVRISVMFGTSAAAYISEFPVSTASTTPAFVTVTGTAPPNAAFCEIVIRADGVAGSQGVFTSISVREIPGNHLIQPTATSRPTLSSRYNLLTKTEQFDDAVWTKQGVTVTANTTLSPDGTLTADSLIPANGSNAFSGVYRAEASAPTKTLVFSVKKGSKRWVCILGYNGSAACWFDLDLGVVGARGANFSASSITALSDGWYQITATFGAALLGANNTGIYCSDADGVFSCVGNGVTAGIYVWGASLVPASDAALPYQRVNTATDYDYDFSKFPPYLKFDGVDDSLYTAASVNFNGAPADGQTKRNLLSASEAFDDGVWPKTNTTVTANATTAPDGLMTADKLVATAVSSVHAIQQNVTLTAGAHTYTVRAKAGEYGWLAISLDGSVFVYYNLTTGVLGTVGAGHTASISPAGGGYYDCAATFTFTAGAKSIFHNVASANNTVSFTGNGTDGIFVAGAQLEAGSTATAYQKTGTDKMTVFAGVHKASDAALGMFLEYGNGGTDSFQVVQVQIPGSNPTTQKVITSTQGTAAAYVIADSADYSAPKTLVYSAVMDIAGDSLVVRLNSAQVGSSSADQGTGNYGNKPLYIGRRNNDSFPFSGRIYQLAIKGKSLSAGEVSTLESYINSKTKAF